MKRKQEQRQSQKTLASTSNKFTELMQIITSELKEDKAASKLYSKIVDRIDRALGLEPSL